MASAATYVAEWFRQRLSSAVTFQKQFVDDVTEKVKEQKAQFDRHTREANERAIQLHLDDLEEKYLCCVCGRGGEAREDDEYVYDTYSMVELPPRMTLEAAVREELADAEMTDERIKQHQRELAVRQRSGSQATTLRHGGHSRHSDNEDVGVDEDDNSSFASTASGSSRKAGAEKGKGRHRRHKAKTQARQSNGRHRAMSHDASRQRQREDYADNSASVSKSLPISPTTSTSPTAAANRHGRMQTAPGENRPGELAVMDPDMVGPLEVRNTLYKIRHAVLHKEARTRRKAVAVHKDKGLMKIEESEIDMFSHFFQRPVHGYLCSACYTCARRRLDTLTQQIRGILFKAQNPILRRVASKELIALSSTNQVPLVLIQSILTVQKRWSTMSEEERTLIRGVEVAGGPTQTPAAALESEERTSWNTLVNGETVVMGSLSEKCILLLREQVKCGACQRRAACFFEQRSVVFLCQFCTARDRFYREHAVCINDEAMPLNLVHMLQDFAIYYQALHQQMELRGAPQSAIEHAQTDLFPLTEVMREPEGLFACLAAETETASASVPAAKASEATGVLETPIAAPVAAPSTFAATTRIGNSVKVPLREQRERVGRTMVSLFDGIKIESTGLNLFDSTQGPQAASAAAAALSSASPPTPPVVAPQTPTAGETDMSDLFDFTAPSTAAPAQASVPVEQQQRNGTVAGNWIGGAGGSVGQSQVSTPPPSGAGSSSTQNPDWEGLF